VSFDAAEKARQGPMTHDTALARRVAEMEASRFWKPVVRRLYSLYVQHKRHLWLEICAQLSAGHWRQLMDWAAEVRKFLDAAPHCCSAPPPLPLDLLAYILACYVRGQVTSVNRCLAALTCPLWYLETMLVVRLLLGGPKGGRGFRVPSRAVQFTMQLGSSLAVSAFVRTMGATWHEDNSEENMEHLISATSRALERHGGDVLLACQHVLVRLYPDGGPGALRVGRRPPLTKEEMPSLSCLAYSVGMHFTAQALSQHGHASQGDQNGAEPASHSQARSWSSPCAPDQRGGSISEQTTADPSHTSSPSQKTSNNEEAVRHDSAAARQDTRLSHGSASNPQFQSILSSVLHISECDDKTSDRFMRCLRDVLWEILGPAAATPEDLPDLPPSPPGKDGPLDVRSTSRVVRAIIQAYFSDPALLAAREEKRAWQSLETGNSGADVVSAGSFAGPSEPGDYVPVSDPGPLRRNIVFMEQSVLLQVVQARLVAEKFKDVAGSNKQLSSFRMRNIRVLWLDLRRCTSTLKRSPATVDSTFTAQLMVRHLRLRAEHDWDATLASLPVEISGSSQVNVRGLNISVHVELSREGLVFRELEVDQPELEIQLHCSTTLSQILMSAAVSVFQERLQEHLQQQIRNSLFQLLKSESSKWNSNVWSGISSVVPERLILKGLTWMAAHIPPEGIPI